MSSSELSESRSLVLKGKKNKSSGEKREWPWEAVAVGRDRRDGPPPLSDVLLSLSVTEDEAKEVHRSLKTAAGIFKHLKVK